MLILVGEEENKDRKKYLGLDKEYVATFLVGVSTDTGDILGEIKNADHRVKPVDDGRFVIPAKARLLSKGGQAGIQTLKNKIKSFTTIKKQKYPWFSSRTVNGKPLWEYYREGDLNINRPERKVEIKKVKLLIKSQKSKEKVRDYIFDSIRKVKGDFRQEKILERWCDFFEVAPLNLTIFKIRILVSSGTFLRVLTEEFDFPVCLLKLKRTKVCLDNIAK